MKTLIDVLNLNADASCLSSSTWLGILKGKTASPFCRWLNLYVKNRKKVTLGLTGSTIVDLAKANPEAIKLINDHLDVFEIIVRPFSHDVALLRTTYGFEKNINIGQSIIQKEFNKVCPFFLPPEFMLTNEQIAFLKQKGIQAVFINSARFPDEIKSRIPIVPYEVRAICSTSLGCIPIEGKLTSEYLYALHNYTSSRWNRSIKSIKTPNIFSWRDGESSFLIPDGIHREELWLKNESGDIHRQHLQDLQLNYLANDRLPVSSYQSYPIHSFSAWMEGLRMLGFIQRVWRIEERLKEFTNEQLILWLHVIGSDILSAVEKKSPQIKIKTSPHLRRCQNYIIHRSERGFEGEEYICLLEEFLKNGQLPAHIYSKQANIVKLKNRLDYFRGFQI